MASDSGRGGSHLHDGPRTAGHALAPGAARNTTAPGSDATPGAPSISGSAPASLSGAARHRTAPRPSPPPDRTPRLRVEVHVNELSGTMSWRTLGDRAGRPARDPVAYGGRHGGPGPLHPRTPTPRLPGEAPWSVRAAAFRSTGLDPARAPAEGAAPIPTHPAAVRAALGVEVASLGPEQTRLHLARIGALRSAVAADLARGAHSPVVVASRLRSTTATPAHAHALGAERTATTRTASLAAIRPPTPATRPGPAATRRR